MLARVLAMALVHVYVYLPQVGVLPKGINGLIWFLARRILSTSPTLCYKETQVSTKIDFPLELFPKLRTWKISLRHIDRRNVLSILAEEGERSERDKLDRRWPTKLTTPPSSGRSTAVVYCRDCQALSTARFCRAGQLATADTCTFRPRAPLPRYRGAHWFIASASRC